MRIFHPGIAYFAAGGIIVGKYGPKPYCPDDPDGKPYCPDDPDGNAGWELSTSPAYFEHGPRTAAAFLPTVCCSVSF